MNAPAIITLPNGRTMVLPTKQPKPVAAESTPVDLEVELETIAPRIINPVQVAPAVTTDTPNTTVNLDANPLQMPVAAMYGYAAKLARATDAPLGWAYASALTMYAGVGVKYRSDASECPPPRLYTTLPGPVHTGKSRTVSRVRTLIQTSRPHWEVETNLNSDRALDSEFGNDEKKDGPIPDGDPEIWAPSHMVYCDEQSTLLRKINIQGSTLAAGLCSLFYRAQGSNSDRKGGHPFFVKLSMLGCLKCNDPDDFKQLWQANTGEGLADRILFVPGPSTPHQFSDDWVARVPAFEQSQLDVDNYACWDRPLQATVHVKMHVFDPITSWQREGGEDTDRDRVAEIAKRVAIISAAVNNDSEITPACIAAALELAKWQERVRRVYSTSQAEGQDAVIAGAILDAFAQETRCLMAAGHKKPYWIELRRLSIKKHWSRKWGSAVTRAWKHLVTDGLLDQAMEEQEHGSFKPAVPTQLKLAYNVSPEV